MPIYLAVDFYSNKFEKVKYQLPEAKDPGGLELKPIMITNLAEFKFLSLNSDTRVVTVDPSLIPKEKWDAMVLLKVRVENKEGLASE